MATSSSDSGSASEPIPVPERVAIETPHGDIRVGDVVDVWMDADAGTIERWYLVEIDGSRYRCPAADAGTPTDAL